MPGSHRRRRSPLSLVGHEADVRFYARRLAEIPNATALVLGSANGRVAWELAPHASKLVAVDPSERMVASAEADRPSQPADSASRVRFLCADLRSLRLGETFPAVLAPQNALGLLGSRADLEALLATVYAHLQPGGVFTFDVLNPPLRKSTPEIDLPHRIEPVRPVFAPHLQEARRGRQSGTSSIRRWRLRQFSPTELDDALRVCGLVPRERYGHFDGKTFEPGDALQVVVAGRE